MQLKNISFHCGEGEKKDSERITEKRIRKRGMPQILYDVSSLASCSLHSSKRSDHIINIYKELWELQPESVSWYRNEKNTAGLLTHMQKEYGNMIPEYIIKEKAFSKLFL